MEARQGKLVFLVLAIAGAALSAQDGAATGTLTLNGSTVPLRYTLYASARPGFFDKKTEDIHVLLSTVPLADEARADVFSLMRLAREGQAQIVEVVLDASAQPISGSLFAKAFDGMVSVSGIHRFEKQAIERSRIAGRFSMAGPQTFAGITFEYEATFAAAIPRPPTAAERTAALASPPAIAARAHVAAIRSGRVPDLIATLTTDAASDYRGPDASARLATLRAETPADSRVVDLRLAGETAVATVQGHRDGIIIESSLTLMREGGVWKVGK